MSSNLDSLIASIDASKEVIGTDIDSVPRATRAGVDAAIRAAKDQLKVDVEMYKQELLKRSVDVFVFGDRAKSQDFAVIAETEGGFSVDTEALYRRLAEAIEPAVGARREFTSAHMSNLVVALKEVAMELSIQSMPLPQLTDVTVVPTFQDLVNYVRVLIRGSIGDSLNQLYISNALVDTAMGRKYRAPALVAILTNTASLDEARELATIFATHNPSVTLKEETVIDKDLIVNSFKNPNKKPKNTSKSTPSTPINS